MSNFRIAFEGYELTLERTRLTYTLTETTTQTVWASGLSLGSITLTERATGHVTVYPFGDLKLVSLSEKAGAGGKRILFGLEAPGGVPVDVYVTCSEREIQLTVEASRDTKTHEVGDICLLPGLCAVPDDGFSHIVLPIGAGRVVYPLQVSASQCFRVWQPDGLFAPFVGGILPTSALALITDSAYAQWDLVCGADRNISGHWTFTRDPERRRLDVRIALIPHGDAISIARVYREKIIGEGNHRTLRKKMREYPALQASLGRCLTTTKLHLASPPSMEYANLWERMDEHLQALQERYSSRRADHLIGGERKWGDWTAPFVEFWRMTRAMDWGQPVPLLSVIYHDSVVFVYEVNRDEDFLRALLRLGTAFDRGTGQTNQDGAELLARLHGLTFMAFLVSHRHLTVDRSVEEAVYSDKTRVVVNRSDTNAYEDDELHLPPLGFYVRHTQLTAHCALRVGEMLYETAAWRVMPEA